jgi:hypothetical protein
MSLRHLDPTIENRSKGMLGNAMSTVDAAVGVLATLGVMQDLDDLLLGERTQLD